MQIKLTYVLTFNNDYFKNVYLAEAFSRKFSSSVLYGMSKILAVKLFNYIGIVKKNLVIK